jgi:membrane-associated protease RseP (regulator of RpoE activity)
MQSALFRPGDRPLLNLGLLVATIATTFTTYLVMFQGALSESIAFSLTLVLILGAHEMGHYVLARIHNVDTSLPYFIPLPLLGVGTLGAVIRIRSRIPDRNALVDIGAAGPLAGLLVAIPFLVFGITHSTVTDSPAPVGFPGPYSLWVLLPELGHWIIAKLTGSYVAPPDPTRAQTLFGDNLLVLGLQRLLVGDIGPGKELVVPSTFVAAWFGLLVTMLNLIPIGQLDGGHLSHAVFGSHARTIGKVLAVGMLFLCIFYSAGWLLWLIVTTRLIGFKHPEVVLPEEPLSLSRKLICALCLIALIVCIMPTPITQVMMP